MNNIANDDESNFFNEELNVGELKSAINLEQIKKVHFSPPIGAVVQKETGEVIDIFGKLQSQEARNTIRQLVHINRLHSTDNVTILSSPNINYSTDGIKTFRAVFTSLFLIDTSFNGVIEPRRYFILGKEYGQEDFYKIIVLKPALKELGEQFRAYDRVLDEKTQLNQEIKPSANTIKTGAELKI